MMGAFVVGTWLGAVVSLALFRWPDWSISFAVGATACWIVGLASNRALKGGNHD